jgi:hypothetical protein
MHHFDSKSKILFSTKIDALKCLHYLLENALDMKAP